MVSTRPMSTRVSSASAGAELQPRSPRYNVHHRPLQAMNASLALLRTVPRILLLYALDDWASNYYWGSKDCIDFIYYNTILGKQDWL
jgi:hypothetical protein